MRYMQYFTRYRFIQDLSSFDEDDTVSEREEEQKVMEDYPLLDIQQSEAKRREEYNDMPVNNTLQHMASYIGKNHPFDNMVDEFVLHTYDNIDEQEFQVCKEIIWTLWDIREPLYGEVVARILNSDEEKRSKKFSNIKEIEDTIQRLIRKGILFQRIAYICMRDETGNIKKISEEPYIIIPFTKFPDEAIKAIGEMLGQTIKSFFSPHTNT